MKKKFFLIVLLAGAMVFSVGQLSAQVAGGCNGTTPTDPLLICGGDQEDQAFTDALNNCCSGSVIYFYDFCGTASGIIFVMENGPNSSCSVE